MKLRFLTGLAMGYVFGTRAGREQYDKLVASVRDLGQSDTVRGLGEQARGLKGGTGASGAVDGEVSGSSLATPAVIAGPGASAGTDPTALEGHDAQLGGADPAAGADAAIALPDLEPSTSRSEPPVTSSPGGKPAQRLTPPKDKS